MPITYQPKPQSPGFLTQALMRIGQMLGMDPHPQDQPYGLMARSLLEAQPSGKPASIGPLPEDKAYSDWLGAVHRANPDFGLDPQGLAFQMFAGPLAKTANKEMLKKAQNMLDEGVDRAKIWADTGWFKDVDDKWKFEIDDVPARILPESRRVTVGGNVEHDELFAAYPGLKRVNYWRTRSHEFGPNEGRFSPPGVTKYGEISVKDIAGKGPSKSTTLHELQHAIQGREGFAKGGSTKSALFENDLRREWEKAVNKKLKPASYDDFRRGWIGDFTGEVDEAAVKKDYAKYLKDNKNNRKNLYDPINRAAQEAAQFDIYKRLAGEAEARNVQTRMNFSPEERMAKPPWTTLDVPEDQLLVRGLLGEDVGPQMATVYHGSPHRFSKFDMSKIGIGEGAQAYGHGLYFAESPGVARSYQEKLGDLQNVIHYDAMPVHSMPPGQKRAMRELERAMDIFKGPSVGGGELGFGDAVDFVKAKVDDDPEALKFLENIDRKKIKWGSGNLYEVDLPDEAIGKMLDWDKPLSEQPEAVRGKLEDMLRKHFDEPAERLNSMTGAEIFNDLAEQGDFMGGVSREAFSSELRKMGIPGIKYLDQASRGSGKGTYNYVVFDDQLPTILKRNNESLAERLMR